MPAWTDKWCRSWTFTMMLLTILSLTTELVAQEEILIGRMPTTFNNMPTSYLDASGWFLNTADPANTNKTVNAWKYCYYSSSRIKTQSDLTVAVWRLKNDSVDSKMYYEKVNGSQGDIVIEIDRQYTTNFICQTWVLSENRSFPIQHGDMVGVYFNESVSVHILGDESGENIQRFDAVNNMNDMLSNSTAVAASLYLEAALIVTSNESSIPPTVGTTSTTVGTTPTTVGTTPTTVTPTSPTPGFALRKEDIAWIAISIPIGILLLFVIIILILLCHKYRKLRKSSNMSVHYPYSTALRDVNEPPTVVLEGFTNINQNSSSQNLIADSRLRLSPSVSNDSHQPSNHSIPIPLSVSSNEYNGSPHTAITIDETNRNRGIHMKELSVMKEKPPPFPFRLQSLTPPIQGSEKYNSSSGLKRSKSDMGSQATPQETPKYESLRSVTEQRHQKELTDSTDSNYPYVLHSREALGHTPLAPVRSLPNIFQGEIITTPCDDIYAEPWCWMSPTGESCILATPVYSYPYMDDSTVMWENDNSNNLFSDQDFARRGSRNHYGSVPDLTPRQKASFFIPDPGSDNDSPAHTGSKSQSRKWSAKRTTKHFNRDSIVAGGRRTSNARSRRVRRTPNSRSEAIAALSKCSKKCTPPPTKPKPRPRTKLKTCKGMNELPSKITEESEIVSKPDSPKSALPQTKRQEKEQQSTPSSSTAPRGPTTTTITSAVSAITPPPQGYMKLQKDKMNEYVSMYQHLLFGDESNFADAATEEEVEFERSYDANFANKPNRNDLCQSAQDDDHQRMAAAAGESQLERSGEHVYETTGEYLESVSDFIREY